MTRAIVRRHLFFTLYYILSEIASRFIGSLYRENGCIYLDFDKDEKRASALRTLFMISCKESALLAHLGKALAAVNRTIALGLKGNPSLAAAVGANRSEVLAGTAGSVLAGVTAGLAALGLVLEATLRIELLLTGGEHELLTALLAN